jgi:two-component sensor histidine kinase
MSNVPTSRELKASIEGRIQALAKAHALLSSSRWAGADLTSLVPEELSPYEELEIWHASVVTCDRLTVDQAGAAAQVSYGIRDEPKALRPIVAPPRQ